MTAYPESLVRPDHARKPALVSIAENLETHSPVMLLEAVTLETQP